MKLQFLSGAVSIFFPFVLLAQVGLPSSSQGAMPASDPLTRTGTKAPESSTQLISLTGKVASETGSSIEDRTAVVLECAGTERSRITTDRSGAFEMTITMLSNDSGSHVGQPAQGTISAQSWNQCELYADAPGYESQRLRMFGSQGIGVMQVGTLMLHPLAKQGNAPSVSVISLAAPDKAKKAFEKGQEQEKKGKWAAACDYFKKAVQAYPRYALAWFELGRTQLQQNNFADAQQAFHQATQQDPHYVDAYLQIADVAAKNRDWKELADSTEHIVELSPDSNPNYWFLNSAANFNLGDVNKAETSATRGLRLDPNHKLPQLEYLYGMILARRGEYQDAIFHIQAYLQLDPHAQDAADARNKLGELQKLAISQSSQTASR
jgi:predicted Zn-dependent protease